MSEEYNFYVNNCKLKIRNRLTDENIVNELRCASTKLPVDINPRRTYTSHKNNCRVK